MVYSTYLGGDSIDQANDIAVDAGGNAYITGFTLSTNFPVANAYQPTRRAGQDAFVTKLDPTGAALVYSTFLGSSNTDEGRGIAAWTTAGMPISRVLRTGS